MSYKITTKKEYAEYRKAQNKTLKSEHKMQLDGNISNMLFSTCSEYRETLSHIYKLNDRFYISADGYRLSYVRSFNYDIPDYSFTTNGHVLSNDHITSMFSAYVNALDTPKLSFRVPDSLEAFAKSMVSLSPVLKLELSEDTLIAYASTVCWGTPTEIKYTATIEYSGEAYSIGVSPEYLYQALQYMTTPIFEIITPKHHSKVDVIHVKNGMHSGVLIMPMEISKTNYSTRIVS